MTGSACPECREAPLPENATFCPSCGHSIKEGAERPRQQQESSWGEFLDSAWDFFASTKVAIALIILIATVSIAGTLVEQEDLYQDWRPPHMYYPFRYGPTLGPLLMKTGLTHAYTAVWFQILILLIVINLIICSLHRLVPLHRVLQNPQVWKLPHFIKRQEVVVDLEGDLETMAATLRKRGYSVLQDRECLYGDKGRIGRYGAYIIHIGLLLVAFAAYSKGFPGWDVTRTLWAADGQTSRVPDTGFAVQSYGFTMETYPSGMPSKFQTDVGIIVDGNEVVRAPVLVNHPLKYGDWEVYQTSFRKEMGTAHLELIDRHTGKPVAKLSVDLKQPGEVLRVTDNLSVRIKEYFHDFAMDPETGQPMNATYEVKNPVMLVEFLEANQPVGRQAVIITGGEFTGEGPYELRVTQVVDRWYSGLTIRKDKTYPWMLTGLGIVLLGMYIAFFVFHRQVWIRQEGGRLLLGARTNKNKYGLKQEMRRITGAPEPAEEA